MSLDEEIRVYERALLRSGKEPREVAAKILGHESGRLLILVRHNLDKEPWFPKAPHRKVTGYMPIASGGYAVEALLALLPVTVDEFADFAEPFLARGYTVRTWDTKARRQLTFYGAASIEKIEEGWTYEPGRDRFGVQGGNTFHFGASTNETPLIRRWATPLPIDVQPFH